MFFRPEPTISITSLFTSRGENAEHAVNAAVNQNRR
jgi:hypothetical protein